MKLDIILLTILIASVFWGAEGSLRGLRGKKSNLFDKKGRSKGSPSSPEEEPTTTTVVPEEPATVGARTEPVATVAASANGEDEYIEVDVALTYSDAISTEEQRQVNLAVMEALNELGIIALTNGAAPREAIMTLDSFSMEETEEALRRRLGKKYTMYIGPCSRCSGGRRERRDLKKAPSIKKALEDNVNKILKEQGLKLKAKVDDVQYFEFEKESS